MMARGTWEGDPPHAVNGAKRSSSGHPLSLTGHPLLVPTMAKGTWEGGEFLEQ
jgi:hypothetical protein